MAAVSTEVVWVSIAGGRLALSHRPKAKSFAALAAHGCAAVVTLLSEREGAQTIGEAVKHAGLDWIWLPLENGNPPPEGRDADVRTAFARVAERLVRGGGILIHCSAGIHRTGMIGYALLRHLGLAEDDANTALRSLRPITAEGVGDARLAWGKRFAHAPPETSSATRR